MQSQPVFAKIEAQRCHLPHINPAEDSLVLLRGQALARDEPLANVFERLVRLTDIVDGSLFQLFRHLCGQLKAMGARKQ